MRQIHDSTIATSTGAADANQVLERINIRDVANLLNSVSRIGLRCGLVVVLVWIGAMKFTAYEAEGISGFVSNSPLMAWAYDFMSHRQFSIVLGIVELTIAVLIAMPKRSNPALIGAGAAVGMFLITLSFMITTPGVFEPTAGGFPALSAIPGQFLVKDFALLGISVRLFADTMNARYSSNRFIGALPSSMQRRRMTRNPPPTS